MKKWFWTDEGEPTLLLGIIFYSLLAFVIVVMTVFFNKVNARERLDLRFSVEIQFRPNSVTEWINTQTKEMVGVGGIQYYQGRFNEYRMVLKVEKPTDLKGVFRARTNLRNDGIALGQGSGQGIIIFGPHDGCQNDGDNRRCDPLSLNDVGLVELRLDVEKATKTALGTFSIRPYDVAPEAVIRPGIVYKGREIPCESTVDKGWWLFAKKLQADSTAIDSISLCVLTPKGERKCAEDQEFEVETRVSKEGKYVIEIWNKRIIKRTCTIYAK